MNVKQAAEIIERCKSDGFVIDLYSNEWLRSRPDFDRFSKEDLAEYQSDSSDKCAGHLFVLHVQDPESELVAALKTLYMPFRLIFDAPSGHKPDFIFINLLTQQIFCLGLGRKNQLFFLELGEVVVPYRTALVTEILLGWVSPYTDKASKEFKDMKSSIERFTKYDFSSAVADFTESLLCFGDAAFKWGHLPLNPDEVSAILEQQPSTEDGLFELDGEFFNREELEQLLSDFDECDEEGRVNLNQLQKYFPHLEWGDLNTQDY